VAADEDEHGEKGTNFVRLCPPNAELNNRKVIELPGVFNYDTM